MSKLLHDPVADFKERLSGLQKAAIQRFQNDAQFEDLVLELARVVNTDAKTVAKGIEDVLMRGGNRARIKNWGFFQNPIFCEILMRRLNYTNAPVFQNGVYITIQRGHVTYLGKAINELQRNGSTYKLSIADQLALIPHEQVAGLDFEAVARVLLQAMMLDPCRLARDAFIEGTKPVDYGVSEPVTRRHRDVRDVKDHRLVRFLMERLPFAQAIALKNGLDRPLQIEQVVEVFSPILRAAYVGNRQIVSAASPPVQNESQQPPRRYPRRHRRGRRSVDAVRFQSSAASVPPTVTASPPARPESQQHRRWHRPLASGNFHSASASVPPTVAADAPPRTLRRRRRSPNRYGHGSNNWSEDRRY